MPELRKDPITNRWVIISTERGKRPGDWLVGPKVRSGGFCPFCPGNEDKTPPEIVALRPNSSAPNTTGWSIRVVPNKFPALQIEGDLNPRGEGLYDLMNGVGAHEVIIETPNHLAELADLSLDHVQDILLTYRARILDLKNDTRFKYILVFKNRGTAAGASLEHSHSQLIATPIIPKRVQEELFGAHQHFELKERCIYCDILRQELHSGKRVVVARADYVAIEPFAPRFPFETWLLPTRHVSHFEATEPELYHGLAVTLQETLQRISSALDDPHYNFILHTFPLQEPASLEYHWHLEIIPKLTRVAGFEWGSGFYINPTPPEIAAQHLRDARL
ncbi:MAG: galactose-1-phosphate uridylyltransferase [candidate division KSB1 bacterium]|nr:galactose-1-phosphate uridylyltransferase [candidate division KSB1 bacterium]MDZ7276014.1 galactose-1-phosphate uridylyltransferase [candidate division KSB1 bacterium]MDZ7285704.1 galactose-1-phosphate uridylyltransferase [candidate division KSB1 bacterium]MDZ7298736.1 galactose-1-phosphate uridylyltransferase [candidate division KSB1 bacterium]MDZ7305919.1 galactose-1-phosphate uridylyltransferase [candidate division KSB1 bacterium]